MKSKSRILSLESWPTQPYNYHPCDRLSPLTEKILITTKIDHQDILPISMQDYARLYEIEIHSKISFIPQYKQEIDLRRKRVELLKSLWEKMNKKRNEISHRNSSVLFPKKCTLGKNSIKNKEESPTSSKNKKKSKSPSPLIFKVASKKKKLNVQYFNDLEYHCKHTSNTDQSTKSKATITRTLHSHSKKHIIPNDDYFESKCKVKNRKLKIKIEEEQNKQLLIVDLGNLMNQWSQLYDKHVRQEYQSTDLTENQRKRLEKMHEIEKKQLKTRIDELSRKIYEKANVEKR